MEIVMKQKIRHLIYFIILVALDQVVKYWVRTDLKENGPMDIIPKVLKLEFHQNTGAVWGTLSGKVQILAIFSAIIFLVILYLYFKIPNHKKFTALKLISVFIMAGAVGNMIDRFVLHYVVDYIYFVIIDFPLFNLADSYITVSAFLMIFLILFYYKEDDMVFLNQMFSKKKPSIDQTTQDSVNDKDADHDTEQE